MTVLKIKGLASLKAWNVWQQLLLGVSCMPEHCTEKREEFFKRVSEMSSEEQEKIIFKAINFVPVDSEDLKGLLTFVADKNGVPYSSENIRNLELQEIVEMIFLVCKELAKIGPTDLVSEDEKKKSEITQSI